MLNLIARHNRDFASSSQEIGESLPLRVMAGGTMPQENLHITKDGAMMVQSSYKQLHEGTSDFFLRLSELLTPSDDLGHAVPQNKICDHLAQFFVTSMILTKNILCSLLHSC